MSVRVIRAPGTVFLGLGSLLIVAAILIESHLSHRGPSSASIASTPRVNIAFDRLRCGLIVHAFAETCRHAFLVIVIALYEGIPVHWNQTHGLG